MREDKRSGTGTICPIPPKGAESEDRGWLWVLGAFLICPCHLPLTLGILGSLLAGTAVGALVSGHPYIAGAVITVVWLAATLRGIVYMTWRRRDGEAVTRIVPRSNS